jgi:tetratricopeptide (TPR) repeat protein
VFNNRGVIWDNKREYGKALADFNEATRLDPGYAEAFFDRALVLAICPDAKYRDGKKAVESAQRACELTDWKVAKYIVSLAAAYAEAGDFQQAIEYEKKALEDPAFAKAHGAEARKRLKLYEAGKPFRQ